MAQGIDISIEVVGDEEAADNLDQVSHRMRNAHDAFENVLDALEEGERRHFDRLCGRYVRTGTLLESLTQPHANGALRELHGDGAGLTFGTSIWYAKFLTKRRKEAESGQARKRTGKSAVLARHQEARLAAAARLRDRAARRPLSRAGAWPVH